MKQEKVFVLIGIVCVFIIGIIGVAVISALVTDSWYLHGFSVVSKEVVEVPDNFWVFQHSITEYRVFYGNSTTDYIITTLEAFNNASVGNWFTGPFLMYG